MDSITFYIFLFAHIIFLITGFGTVLVIDFFGLLWFRKKISTDNLLLTTGHAQKLIWLGWIGLVISGVGLITIKGYLDNLTQIKLFFVILVGLNGIFLNKIHRLLSNLDNNEMSKHLKFKIILTSIISQIGWWGAITIGFLHRHWQHNIPWPENPWLYIATISGSFFVVYVIGEIVLNSRYKK
ncbi:MAG TPA: hypothetical protein VJH71_00820 [Candidatus Paceibacterota bacterium]